MAMTSVQNEIERRGETVQSADLLNAEVAREVVRASGEVFSLTPIERGFEPLAADAGNIR